MATKVFVFGASGHAKVVIDILERAPGMEIAFAVDDATAVKGRPLCGYPIIGGRDELLAHRAQAGFGIVTIGDNAARRDIAAWLVVQGFQLARAIHPAAMLARDVTVGDGTVIMAGCVINTDSVVGANVIVNTGSTVDHDCAIGDGVHLAPGCHLCGGVKIGAGSFLGAGTTVVPGVRIGVNAIVGAGSTVLDAVPDGARVAGSPARPLESAP
ncbi:MAG: acetyltransferase [Betaproteobacteria bacterium]|nr:acetyltransferase [Betaproteobacteria bacterium]MBI2289809.1 acetyltransferase [Betaproteobacteria bacterium]MBI3055446.1 acetyltransferase [Betaproteobacteria bacterium]